MFAVCERERGRAETRDGEVGIFHLDIEGKGGKHFFFSSDFLPANVGKGVAGYNSSSNVEPPNKLVGYSWADRGVGVGIVYSIGLP